MQQKPDDRWTVPGCKTIPGIKLGCHGRQHTQNELAFWDSVDIDPFDLAERLYAEYLAGLPEKAASEKPARKPRKAKAAKKTHQRSRPIAKRANPWPKRKFQKRSK